MTTYSYQIEAYQVDFQAKVTLMTICNYLLQTAGQDAKRLGFGLHTMRSNNRAWVMSRLNLQIQDYPGPNESLQIQTWIHDIGSIFTCRKFFLLNGNGQKIGEASSSWVAMDLNSRRPLRLQSLLDKDHIVHVPEHQLEAPPKLEALQQYDHQHAFQVVYSDLDLNRHVYSIRYIEWMLNRIPLDHFSEKKLARLDVNYLSEAVYGDEMLLWSSHSREASAFSIGNERSGKSVGVGRIIWM